MPSSSIAGTTPFLLDGRWVSDGLISEIKSPYDKSIVGSVALADKEQVQHAIDAAVRAFEITRKLPAYERQQILQKISHGIAEKREDFARMIALEAGKPIKTARAEVDRAIFTFSIAAEEAVRIRGEWLPMDLLSSTAGRWGIVRLFPLGPVAAITPFNFPLNLVAHKVAPAIATGCTMVLKPAHQTPLTAVMLAEIVNAAGWPAGALNVLPMNNENASALVTDDRLKLLTFTGSSTVGWMLKSRTGKKRVALELGGNAGVVIHSDADLDYAAERCAVGGFSYAGQSCIAVQRILVHGSVFDKFTQKFLERVRLLRVGDPLDDSTDVGPVITEDDAIRAESWTKEAVAAGAKLLCGGKRNGALVEPTVLTGTNREMKVSCEEVFAPVKVVEPYDQFETALATINDSRYGLQAGVFTNDARLIFKAYDELEVGGVTIGEVPTFRIDHMPYGGVKDSGMGREGIRYAIEEMTERKLLVMNVK